MSPLVALILVTHIAYTFPAEQVYLHNRRLLAFWDISPQIGKSIDKPQDTKSSDQDVVHISISSDKSKKASEVITKKPSSSTTVAGDVEKNDSIQIHATKENDNNNTKHTFNKPIEMESGALFRGVLVVVAITIFLIIYVAVKTYYGKRNKQPAMVRKYGVRTRRSDIEMTPLPLDEDEEDETLFEINNTNR